MAKPVHKGSDPYRHRLLDLGMGMLGGVLAGAGVSYLISSQQRKRMELKNSGESHKRVSQRNTQPRQNPSTNRRNSGARRRSKTAGTHLASSNIQPQELQAREEPGTNDSLGG